ncbi:hypothetical protein CXB51_007450 [Gossypium anomalum]|uniref:Uncharacterized protein n=2 Tax=Gossypium TaxID=3633 RepID=A0A8J5YZU1_9ROSI|nr:hypothetical protein CXB51_007450 [Gossypium anomalum]
MSYRFLIGKTFSRKSSSPLTIFFLLLPFFIFLLLLHLVPSFIRSVSFLCFLFSVFQAMVLIAKMEGSLSALFHARFSSKRLLIMGISRGLSFNVGINFIWRQLVTRNQIRTWEMATGRDIT